MPLQCYHDGPWLVIVIVIVIRLTGRLALPVRPLRYYDSDEKITPTKSSSFCCTGRSTPRATSSSMRDLFAYTASFTIASGCY